MSSKLLFRRYLAVGFYAFLGSIHISVFLSPLSAPVVLVFLIHFRWPFIFSCFQEPCQECVSQNPCQGITSCIMNTCFLSHVHIPVLSNLISSPAGPAHSELGPLRASSASPGCVGSVLQPLQGAVLVLSQQVQHDSGWVIWLNPSYFWSFGKERRQRNILWEILLLSASKGCPSI